MLYIWEVSSLAPSCTQDCISSPKYICDHVGAMITSFWLINQPAWRPYEVEQLLSRSKI